MTLAEYIKQNNISSIDLWSYQPYPDEYADPEEYTPFAEVDKLCPIQEKIEYLGAFFEFDELYSYRGGVSGLASYLNDVITDFGDELLEEDTRAFAHIGMREHELVVLYFM